MDKRVISLIQIHYFRILALCFITLVISACATIPQSDHSAPVLDHSTKGVYKPDSGSVPSDTKVPPAVSKQMSSSKAVITLLRDAVIKRRQGNLKISTALLERALRIEPKNPNVWHQLADVRFREKKYKLAESLALKSSTLSPGNPILQARNWRLISDARLKRGNTAGSRRARQKALKMEKTDW